MSRLGGADSDGEQGAGAARPAASHPELSLGAAAAGAEHRVLSAPAQPPAELSAPPEARFAESNHGNIVSHIRTELLPQGGRMQIRLDPPELGVLNITVQMQDGVMTAAFHTASEQAANLLSHSLHELKGVLESQGVQVEKLQVQQSPREFNSHAGDDQRQQPQDDPSSRQEQQRRQMLRRMWAKLGLGGGPLDVTG